MIMYVASMSYLANEIVLSLRMSQIRPICSALHKRWTMKQHVTLELPKSTILLYAS